MIDQCFHTVVDDRFRDYAIKLEEKNTDEGLHLK